MSAKNERFAVKKLMERLYPILLILIGLALFVRCRYGFDWSDESYYTTLAYRLARGDALFSEMWELHQLSVIPLLPLAKLFLWLNAGGTAGMIPFFRGAFVVFETLVALTGYFILRKRYAPLTAFLASALMLGFTHFALPNFSYDSMPPLLLFLSFVLLPSETERRFSLKLGISGFLYALSVQCYPQFALSLPLVFVFLFLHYRRGGLRARALIAFFSGCAALALLFAAFVFTNSSFAALFENLPYILDDPTHGQETKIHLLLNYFHTLIVVFGPVFYAAVGLFAAALIRFKKDAPRARRILFLLTLLLGVASVLRLATYPTVDPAGRNNFLAMALVPLCPILLALEKFRPSRTLYLMLSGICFSLSAQLYSNMGIYASSFPLILVTVAVILYAAESDVFQSEASRCLAALLPVMASIVLCAVLVLRIFAMHREAPLSSLTAELSRGPAKGVITTEASSASYKKIVSAVSAAAPGHKSILTTSMLPFGYLIADLSPASPSVWSADYSERLKTYYHKNPDRLPDLILTVTEGVGFSSGDGGAAELMDWLSETYGRTYSIVEENEACRIYGLNS